MRRIGLGTFVASRPVESRIDAERVRSFEEQMEETGAHVTFRLLAFDVERASAAVAAALELPATAEIYRLRRLRLVEGEIIGLEDRAMPERIGSAHCPPRRWSRVPRRGSSKARSARRSAA